MEDMRDMINDFNYYIDNKQFDLANEIAEKMIKITMQTYNSTSEQYRGARKEEMRQSEINMWDKSTELIKPFDSETIFLDVGAGFGKDMYYANNVLKVKTYGVDNSSEFIKILFDRAAKGDFDKNLIYEGDMRNMSFFHSEMFDLVRSNASLLHLPVIAKGYMADLAVSEFFRVLKPGGILYLLLKKGKGLQVVDTKENLGGRLYQFFEEDDIQELLKRNGFDIVFINTERRSRLDYYIDWINVIARKP